MGTCGWAMCGACGWVVCDASGCVNRDLVLGYVFIEVTLVKVARSLCKPIPVEMERVQMNNTTSGAQSLCYPHQPVFLCFQREGWSRIIDVSLQDMQD